MPRILRSARPSDFPTLYERFFGPLNKRLPRKTWERLFTHHWGSDDQSPGQVLLIGGIIVGFAGFVHARLPRPDGTTEPLCNLTTWVVAPGYESQALSMIMPVLGRTDLTLTNLTSIRSVHSIFSRLGFSELERSVCVLRPVLWRRPRWGRSDEETDVSAILSALPVWERRIAADHRPYANHLMLRERGGRYCYVIYTIVRRHRLRTARIHWVTPGVLAECSVDLRRALFRQSKTVLAEVDHRFAPHGLPAATQVPLKVPRLFRSARLDPDQVPNAYSEMILLDL